MAENKILFVDDNPLSVRHHVEAIRSKGYDVVSAASLLEGMKILESDGADFSMVVIDVMMPITDLPESLKDFLPKLSAYVENSGVLLGLWLAKKYPNLPFVYLTVEPAIIGGEYHAEHPSYRGLLNKWGDDGMPARIGDKLRSILSPEE